MLHSEKGIKESKSGSQLSRIIDILLFALKGEKFTINDIKEYLQELGHEINEQQIRTLQRDIKYLIEDKGLLSSVKQDKQYYYKIQTDDEFNGTIQKSSYFQNNLLSIHFLKSHLKNYRNTVFDKQIDKLIKSIDKEYPGEVVPEDYLYWNHTIGEYDYSKFNLTIEEFVNAITNKKWVTIVYKRYPDEPAKKRKVFPVKMFSYDGSLYIIVKYEKYENVATIRLERVTSVTLDKDNKTTPIIDFNFEDFFHDRFGVFGGENQTIRLLIRKGAEDYFIGHKWHPTQKFTKTPDGTVLEFQSPISPELISFILKWNTLITILEPTQLITYTTKVLKEMLDKYEK